MKKVILIILIASVSVCAYGAAEWLLVAEDGSIAWFEGDKFYYIEDDVLMIYVPHPINTNSWIGTDGKTMTTEDAANLVIITWDDGTWKIFEIQRVEDLN